MTSKIFKNYRLPEQSCIEKHMAKPLLILNKPYTPRVWTGGGRRRARPLFPFPTSSVRAAAKTCLHEKLIRDIDICIAHALLVPVCHKAHFQLCHLFRAGMNLSVVCTKVKQHCCQISFGIENFEPVREPR